MKRILFISGSLRAASASTATARALSELITDSASFSMAEIGDLPLYNADLVDDPNVTSWIEQVQSADGLVFITPEYNYSIPGVLKNAIDWASRPALKSVFVGKKCFVMSVSAGALGGVRAQSHLKYVLNAMLAEVFVCPEIVVPMANKKVENGKLNDESILVFTQERLGEFVATL